MCTWAPKAAISFYLSTEDEKDIRLLAYATNQNMTEFMSVICKKIIKKNRAFLD